MSMPATAIDEDNSWLEAEIERELELIDLSTLDESKDDLDNEELNVTENNNNTNDEGMPDILQEYLHRVESRSCHVEQELEECEEILNPAPTPLPSHTDITEVLSQFEECQGKDPETLRNEILAELEEEDENDDDDDNELPETYLTEITEDKPSQDGNDLTAQPGGGTIAVVYEFHTLEKEAREQLKVLDDKLKVKELQRTQNEEMLRHEAQSRQEHIDEERQRNLRAIKEEESRLSSDKNAKQLEFEKQAKEQQRRIELELKKFEDEMAALTEQTKKETEEFENILKAERLKEDDRKEKAAIKIQSVYKRFRVRKTYGAELDTRIEEKKKMTIQTRLGEIEKQRNKVEEEKRKKIEQQRQEDERKREEERKRKAEEEQRKLEEEKKRVEDERKRIEEEKKKEEEKRRLEEEEEKRRLDEEQKKKEEEEMREQKRRQEEEDRKKEEERKRLEEEKRLAEENRKREEELRLIEERRKAEEEKKILEEKKRMEEKRQEEERKKLEEDKRREEAEAEERKKQEKKRQEEETRKLEEQRKIEEDLRIRAEAEKIEKEKQHKAAPENCANTIDDKLAETIENERLKWIQNNKPYSQVCSEQKTKKYSKRRPPRRPLSAKNLSPLADEVILQAARVSALKQVTTVELCDLPGCSLSTLSQCGQLKTLSMKNCGIIALDELEGCTQLQYIDVSSNSIEMINLKDLNNLVYLDLSHNNMSSIHGLDSCENLHSLNLSYNKITRIAGLGVLGKLHKLDLSHNQLISTKGLGEGTTVHVLDISHNHLQSVDEISSLCLLGVLRAVGNNILEIPDLSNHVLLRELVLDDNSISSLSVLANYWLPLLVLLSLSQNSITVLDELRYCQLLNTLDLSNNQIAELPNLIPGLKILRSLDVLILTGNPVTEDPNFSTSIKQQVPLLRQLDDTSFNTDNQQAITRTHFEAACLKQIKSNTVMKKIFQDHLQSLKTTVPMDLLKVSLVTREFLEKSFKLAEEHRNAHEYGDFESAETDETLHVKNEAVTNHIENGTASDLGFCDKQKQSDIDVKPGKGFDKSIVRTKESSELSGKDKFDMLVKQAAKDTEDSKEFVTQSKETVYQSKETIPQSKEAISQSNHVDVTSTRLHEHSTKRNGDAVNSYSYDIRKPGHKVNANHVGKLLVEEGITPKASPPSSRKPTSAGRRQTDLKFKQHKAAVVIQSLWRGYLSRQNAQRLKQQRAGIAKVNGRVGVMDKAAIIIQSWWRGYSLRKRLHMALSFARMDSEDEDDFFDQEIDLDDFNPDKIDLDSDWLPPSTPQIPKNHPVLNRPPKHRARPESGLSDGVPPLPKEAWRNSPIGGYPLGKPPLPPDSRMSGADTHRTALSKKEEVLSEEWGFKDTKTAELMMQRAKKLKYNAQHKKKLSKLDPKQRLALFRKLEEAAGIPRVQNTNRKLPERKDYFQAREEEEHRVVVEKEEKQAAQHLRTFQWVHSQVGTHDVTDPTPSRGFYNRTNSLPQMDPNVVSGGRVQLTTSPSPSNLELQSIESGSISGHSLRQRRHSFGNNTEDRIELPPIKTNSAPSERIKERISFRDTKVDQGPGWGSGKKRKNKRR